MKQLERKEFIQSVKKDVLKKIICDICGREIIGDYYEATTHHNNWGNYSVEGYEYWDLCSMDCLKVHLENHYCDDDSQYYEIETSCFQSEKEV